MQRLEDSSLRQLWRLTSMLFRVRNGALTLRDVKNEDRPGYVYENTGDDDKMSGEKTGFCRKMPPFHDNRQQSVGTVDRGCTAYAINQGEGGPRIGSSVHRLIDPSEEHGVGFRWHDDPTVRWADHRGSP
jgi:hypothetical protein